MQKNAKVGGVLSIVAGAFGVLGLLFCILMAVFMMLVPEFNHNYYYNDSMGPREMFTVMAVIYIIFGGIGALVGVLAVVGGVFALRRKHWGWALAGSIAATLAFFPCGIPAIIFTALGKPEFEGLEQPALTEPITG